MDTEFPRIIEASRSIIPALDVESKKDFGTMLRATVNVEGIYAYKFGITQGLQGLESMIAQAKDMAPQKDVICIYDHQKGGNDIPDMGRPYARTLASCGVDAGILFPFTGPITQEAWTLALQDVGIIPIVGGIMTHKKFLKSEGGYIDDGAPELIYRLAAKMGVRHFVVPGNKLDWVQKIKGWLDEELGEGNYVLYAPGFITQGGDLSECGKIAGKEFHGIVGSGIYGKDKLNSQKAMRAAAMACASKLSLAA